MEVWGALEPLPFGCFSFDQTKLLQEGVSVHGWIGGVLLHQFRVLLLLLLSLVELQAFSINVFELVLQDQSLVEGPLKRKLFMVLFEQRALSWQQLGLFLSGQLIPHLIEVFMMSKPFLSRVSEGERFFESMDGLDIHRLILILQGFFEDDIRGLHD